MTLSATQTVQHVQCSPKVMSDLNGNRKFSADFLQSPTLNPSYCRRKRQTDGRTDGRTGITVPTSALYDHGSVPEHFLGTVRGTKCSYIRLTTKKAIVLVSRRPVKLLTCTAVQLAFVCGTRTTETEELRPSEGTHCHVLHNHFSNVLLLES
jgi:hypothetical protein